MQNIIPTITQPNIGSQVTDKVVTGFLDNVQSLANNLKIGDMMLLDVFVNEISLDASSLIKAKVDNKDVAIKLDRPIKLDVPDLKEKLPVELKVLSLEPNRVNVKLVSIDNQPVEKFVAKFMAPNTNNPNIQPDNIYEIIQNPKAEILSFPIKFPVKLVDDLIQKYELSDTVAKQVRDVVSNIEVPLDIKPDTQAVKNLPQYQLKEGEQPIKNLIVRLDTVLENFVNKAGLEQQAIPQKIIQNFISQVKSEFEAAKNLPIIVNVENVSKNDATFAVPNDKNFNYIIKTPLGDMVAQSPARFENNDQLIAFVKDIAAKEPLPIIDDIKTLKSEYKFLEELVNIGKINLSVVEQQSSKSIEPLVQILRIVNPLKNSSDNELASKILNKFPSPDDNMLSNMVSFIKAAQTKDISKWLGQKLIKEIQDTGLDGKEVLVRLNEMMTSSVKEGQSWRVIELPIFNGETLSKIKVSIKNMNEEDEKDSSKAKGKYGTRFVVDTTFSKLGDFQFDGFSLAKDKRFDLIIRTTNEIGDDMYAHIFKLFKTTLNDVEYFGNLNINIKENFIKICDDEKNKAKLNKGVYI